jgi:hypothetical protein
MTRAFAVGLVALDLSLPLPAFAQTGGAVLRALIEKVDRAWELANKA